MCAGVWRQRRASAMGGVCGVGGRSEGQQQRARHDAVRETVLCGTAGGDAVVEEEGGEEADERQGKACCVKR